MIIRKLYIRGFGKIVDFTLDLSNGLNVVYGANESGKSTLMAFIKAVLYGLKGGRSDKEGQAAGLKRYKPWNSQNYGGYINLELGSSRNYRLDRDFNSNVVRLLDNEFNDITAIYSGTKDGRGIAERITGVNESLFERTVYIKQLGSKIDIDASKDLIERISNMGQSGYEDISYKKAHSALREALKSQVGTDRSYTRPLDLINKRLSELKQRLEELTREEEKRTEAEQRLNFLKAETGYLTQKERLFLLSLEFMEGREKLEIRRDKYKEERQLNESIRELHKSINRLTENKQTLEGDIRQCDKQDNELRGQLEAIEITESSHDTQKLSNLIKVLDIFGAIGLVLMAISVWIALVQKILPEYILSIPAGVLIAVAISRIKKGNLLKESEQKKYIKTQRTELLLKQLESVGNTRAIAAEQLTNVSERLEVDKEQYSKLLNRVENGKTANDTGELVSMEESLDQLSEELTKQLENTLEFLSKGETALIESTLEASLQNGSKSELLRLGKIYGEQLQQKKIEMGTLEFRLKEGNGNRDTAEAVEQEIDRLTQQKRALEQRGEALQLAMSTLEEASREVQKKFLPVMNKVFNSTFSQLTSKRYSDTRAGDNLNIMLSSPESEFVIPVSALSNGTVDQLYLALRVAVSETVLKGNEVLPIILDEPFAQYDDQRTENALRLIGELAEKQQVIIFTCKQREVEMLENVNKKYPCKICSLT